MSGARAGLVAALALCWLAGCATAINPTPVRAPDGELVFIDLDSFDAALAKDLRGRRDTVAVRFAGRAASLDAVPPRLQKWLSAVQRRGGGVSVVSADGHAPKDLAMVLSALAAGYRLVRDQMPSLLGRRYRAVIVLADGAGTIDRIDFVRTTGRGPGGAPGDGPDGPVEGAAGDAGAG